jgi:hypothetical protein
MSVSTQMLSPGWTWSQPAWRVRIFSVKVIGDIASAPAQWSLWYFVSGFLQRNSPEFRVWTPAEFWRIPLQAGRQSQEGRLGHEKLETTQSPGRDIISLCPKKQ